MHATHRRRLAPHLPLLLAMILAALGGSLVAALSVAVGARAKGLLSSSGVSVDNGGGFSGLGSGGSLLDAVRRDVLGRVRCDAPTPAQCVDPAYLDTECGSVKLSQLRSTGTTECSCPTPTLAQCQDSIWVQTLCGQVEALRDRVAPPAACADGDPNTTCPAAASTCRNLLSTEASRLQIASASVVPGAELSTVIVPSTVSPPAGASVSQLLDLDANGYAQPNVTVSARRTEPDYSKMQTSPAGGTYFSRVLQEAVAKQPRAPAAWHQSVSSLYDAQAQAWNLNGNSVESCAEYVFEKYYDYTSYERARLGPGMTPRRAWQVAYGEVNAPTSIGTRGVAAEAVGQPLALRQKDGTLLPIQLRFPSSPQPKNEFFSTPIVTGVARQQALAEYQANGNVSYQFKLWGLEPTNITLPRPVWGLVGIEGIILLDDDLTARIANAAPVQEGWTYHRDRGTQLGPDLDEQMMVLEETRARFVPLLVRWALLASEANGLMRGALPKGEILVDNRPFDPTVFENLMRTTKAAGVAQMSSARASVDSLQSAIFQTPAPVNAGQLTSIGSIVGITGTPISAALSPAVAGGQSTSLTPMSGSFSSTTINLSQAARVLTPELREKLRPLLNEPDSLLGKLQPILYQLAIVSGEIEAALIEARDNACLESTFTTCDWSPQRFLQRVADQFEAERERDFRRCLRTTADDFAQHSIAVNKPGRFLVTLSPQNPKPRTQAWDVAANGLTPCDDAAYHTSPTRFERWMSCFAVWRTDMLAALSQRLKGASQLVNPENGKIEPSESSGDLAETGDDVFGVRAEYGVDWRLTGLPSNGNTSQNRWCSLEPRVHGHMQVAGKILGFDFELVEARADVDTRPGFGSNNRAYIEIGGQEILSAESAGGSIDISKYNLIFEESTTNSYKLFRYSQTFPVGPVWLTVEAGAAGIFGASLLGAVGRLGEATGGCSAGDLGLEGKLEPFVGFQAYASASLDYMIVEAGVKISLTLINLSFPFTLKLTFQGQPQEGNPNLVDTRMTIANNLDMVLQILSGRMSAFVEVCFIFCEEFEATLFEWAGPRWVLNLFKTEFEVPLGTLVQFQQQAEAGFAAAGN